MNNWLQPERPQEAPEWISKDEVTFTTMIQRIYLDWAKGASLTELEEAYREYILWSRPEVTDVSISIEELDENFYEISLELQVSMGTQTITLAVNGETDVQPQDTVERI